MVQLMGIHSVRPQSSLCKVVSTAFVDLVPGSA